jgi:hypothetical protein
VLVKAGQRGEWRKGRFLIFSMSQYFMEAKISKVGGVACQKVREVSLGVRAEKEGKNILDKQLYRIFVAPNGPIAQLVRVADS